jgi:hypothetical protein
MIANTDQIIELIDSLNGLAMYNDKGYIYANHDELQQQEIRNSHRVYINKFIEEHGEKLSPEVIELIFDDSGDYVNKLKRLFNNKID